MGFLYEKDRKTEAEAEPQLPEVHWDIALAALAKKETLHRVCCLSGLQPVDGERFMKEAAEAYKALMGSIKGQTIKTKTEAEAMIRGMVGPDFPVSGFLDLMLTNAGSVGKKATWAELVTAAKTEAV